MILNAAILEPTSKYSRILQNGIADFKLGIHIDVFTDSDQFLKTFDQKPRAFDILILNTTIHQEGDGIELASYVRSRNSNIMICFATQSRAYYPEAFSIFATGYLIYPFDIGELYNCINFYFKQPDSKRRKILTVKEKGGRYRRIFCRNITYIESDNREIHIHLQDNTTISSYTKLSSAMEILEEKQFFRCHQSYVVNLYFVDELKRNFFYIKDAEIPISRKYQKSAKDQYLLFLDSMRTNSVG